MSQEKEDRFHSGGHMHSSEKMFQHLFTKGNFQTNAGHGKKKLEKKNRHMN